MSDILKNIQNKGSSQKGQGSAWLTPKEDPKYAERWTEENIKEYKDEVYNKISALLLKQWSKIELHIDGDGLEALQKTYRDGEFKTGKKSEEMMVVYQNDVDANNDGSKIENALLSWLNFIDINMIDLKILELIEVTDEGKPFPPNLILYVNDGRPDFNLNEVVGAIELSEINLKDNVSQFMKLDNAVTNINRTKLSEHIDTDFSEFTPVTFTHLLERYNKLKNQIPLRYRSDDFFQEYINSNIPAGYRVEKFFEEFERIKTKISCGMLTTSDDINIPESGEITDEELFGWETITYLIANSQNVCKNYNPIFSQADAKSWIDDINQLKTQIEYSIIQSETDKQRIKYLEDYIASLSQDKLTEDEPIEAVYGCTDSSALNYSYLADMDDGSCSYTEIPAVVYGCTDEAALNYNSLVGEDDGSCKYPFVAFEESFNDWQDTYSPSNYWFRYGIGQVIKTDGPDGSGDGAVRIYRSVANGSWPGAFFMKNSKNPTTIGEPFNIVDREPSLLYLQESRTYKFEISARCNTTNTKAMVFIGDTRCPGGYSGGCYSWTKSTSWTTDNNWTSTEFYFEPKKNKHIDSITQESQFPGVMGSIYLYAGTNSGADIGQYCDYANLKITELGPNDFNKGGPIPSTFNPGPTSEFNPEIIIPTRDFNLNIPKPYQRASKKFRIGGRTSPKPFHKKGRK